MRIVIWVAALAVLVTSAEAQQQRPQGQQKPPPAQAKAPPPPAPPPLFPCRTAEEVCYLGVVTGPNQVAILFTNNPQADDLESKPVSVLSSDSPAAAGSGTPLDLGQHLGRVVMLTGTYDAQAGLTKAELVEVANPLVSLTVKAQLLVEEAQASQQRGGKPQPQARPRR
ncbi:MAG TPA: hypothetical protein VH743_03730 [Beijerinckiaceae bacterium]|jgi:hypothetical protein